MSLPVWISAIGTAEPGPPIPQADSVAWLEPRLHPATDRERFRRMAARTEIGFRHAAIDLFGAEGDRFYPVGGVGGADLGARSLAFDRLAPPLAAAAVANACPAGLGPITHLVVTTCTGAVAPGLDIRLCQRLGLPATTRRTAIAFMGCYAAIPALRAAWHTCVADPRARVLVVCCELSSLNGRPGPEDDSVLAGLLFGDGAAAAVVEAADGPVGLGLRIAGDAALLASDSSDQMTWMAHADVFRLHLSPQITRSLAGALPDLARHLLAPGQAPSAAAWAIHPGGPRILDAAATALGLAPGALDPSRRELWRAGNRSSPTVLAIVREHLAAPGPRHLALVAFGPGLTADALLVERCP